MAFGLIIPGILNNAWRSAKEKSDGSISEVMVFLNKVSVSSFPEKVIESYKIIEIKVGKNSFTNVICAGGAHGLSRVIKYFIISEISNLLLIVGIAELHLGNASLGK